MVRTEQEGNTEMKMDGESQKVGLKVLRKCGMKTKSHVEKMFNTGIAFPRVSNSSSQCSQASDQEDGDMEVFVEKGPSLSGIDTGKLLKKKGENINYVRRMTEVNINLNEDS